MLYYFLRGVSGHLNCHYRRASVRGLEKAEDERRATILELYSSTNGGAAATSSLGNDLLHDNSDHDDDEEETVDFAREWRKVAEVFDRLFFWLFLMAILISTLVLFHPLTDSYLKRWNPST